MSTLEEALRSLIRDEVRSAVRDELRSVLEVRDMPRNATDAYLSVTKAARIADVAPGTIRAWIRAGRIESRRAGRVLRVGRTELERFLAQEPTLAQKRDVERRADQIVGRRRPQLRRTAA